MPDIDTAAKLRTRLQREAAGRALRDRVSRESHAQFHVDPNRDPLPILKASDAVRLPPLVPARYRLMAQDPFAFYRGAAAVMAHDMTLMPRIGLPVQACGDCHIMNFGVLSSPEGNVLFDINDFDETYPGVDFVVDLKRLVASVAVAAQTDPATRKDAEAFARAAAAAYRSFMHDLAGRTPLEAWQTKMDVKAELRRLGNADLETKLLGKLLKAERKGKEVQEHPGVADTAAHFDDEPDKVFHTLPDGTPVSRILTDDAFEAYESTLLAERSALLARYALRDVAFKVVGVGSVGTFCAVALLATADDERLILQVKQAGQSAVAGLAPGSLVDAHQGQRVVEGQRALQAAPDVFLGWTQDAGGRHFYVRQLKNRRLASIGAAIEGEALEAYATLCGRTLARAHARTGDAAMIAGYLGGSDAMDKALGAFAMAYAEQTKADHAKLAASRLTKS